MKKSIFLLTFLLFLCQVGFSTIKLPEVVSSNMVLQRNTNINLWGWASPNEKISIKTSWIKKAIQVTADADGKWSTQVKTTLSKTPQSINLKSKESDITLSNILFGEVWLCSGQSNMRQPLKGYRGQPTIGGNEAVAFANNNQIRLFGVKEKASETPLDHLIEYDVWTQATPASVKNFSAVAYFYGLQLQQILDVPVGLIMTSWGGSSVQAWISNDVLQPIQLFDLNNYDLTKRPNQTPTVLYNAMIKPLIPYTIKGALWYQGEANRKEYKLYEELLPAMVKDWRTQWNQGDFPFYYVQIAPFGYKDINSALIRESQLKCLDLIPNSGIAILTDVGEEKCIHPAKKKEVADRLLYNALNKTYGIKEVDCMGPVYKSHEVKDSTIIISFDFAEEGIYSTEEIISGFEIAGEDKVFYPATAQIVNRKSLKVYSAEVKEPVAVRYGWKNWFEGTLFDANELPASTFRSDDWEE
ncbi:sialate O-acetylesterase [Labilibacter sediminis]|nr:sialate O-acetylesterase [Labilibacter sediminis]